jgi:hypothetical protein
MATAPWKRGVSNLMARGGLRVTRSGDFSEFVQDHSFG